jgi:hypothetical protein
LERFALEIALVSEIGMNLVFRPNGVIAVAFPARTLGVRVGRPSWCGGLDDDRYRSESSTK